MNDQLKPAPDIAPANVAPLPKGQKVGMELELYGAHLLPASFREIVEFAQMMCKAGIAIPKHMREQPGVCMSVIQRSLAWQMDPWAVATKTYAVNDILAYEAQLIAAVVMKWAPLKEKVISPKYDGEGQQRRVMFDLTHAETSEKIHYESPRIAEIKVKNSPLWDSDRDQQLFYYGIRAMSRRFFPGLLLGVYDREEAYAMRDITPKETQNFLVDNPETSTETEEYKDAADKPLPGPAGGGGSYGGVVDKVVDIDEPDHGDDGDGGDQVGPHDPETGELLLDQTAPAITVEQIAENMIKGVNHATDDKALRMTETAIAADLDRLPKALQKKVRKAISDRAIDLEFT